MACITPAVSLTGVFSPFLFTVLIPGRPSLGRVFLPASEAFARPTARKNSHCPFPPASFIFPIASMSWLRTRSTSTAPSSTSPSYSRLAFRNFSRHSSRSLLRRSPPSSVLRIASLIASSFSGAFPNIPAQSFVLNILCRSPYRGWASHILSHLRHRSIFPCSLTCFSSFSLPPVFSLSSFILLTSPLAACSMASSRRPALPALSPLMLAAASSIVLSSSA